MEQPDRPLSVKEQVLDFFADLILEAQALSAEDAQKTKPVASSKPATKRAKRRKADHRK